MTRHLHLEVHISLYAYSGVYILELGSKTHYKDRKLRTTARHEYIEIRMHSAT